VKGRFHLSVVVFVTFSSFSQQEPIPVVDDPAAQLAELWPLPPPAIKSPACPTCYTHACRGCYDIFEEVPDTGITIVRAIPNPAPLEPGEVRPDFDPETNLPIWYIGHQGHVGPTDEEPLSPDLPIALIELKRIQARHHKKIFSTPGVTAFGIGAEGFTVLVEPELFDKSGTLVPTVLEEVPVTVEVGGPFVNITHDLTQYRPVPTGASVGRILPVTNELRDGTVGPHIVRDDADLGQGQCCIIYTLTAGHVLKHPKDPPPLPNDVLPTLQPYGGPAQANWGYFIRGFQQTRCDPNCTSPSAPLNDTSTNPDIAVIAHLLSPHKDPLGHTSPAGSVEPIRRLQYGITNFVNGPSGVIQEGVPGSTSLKWWGSRSDAPKGTLEMKNVIAIIADFDQLHGTRSFKYNALDTGTFERDVLPGDSGGLVAGNGVSNRHVYGIIEARDLANFRRGIFVSAGNVKLALQRAGFSFDHYWGTQSNSPNLWRPATTQCDGSC
jgi:hypothetical protein